MSQRDFRCMALGAAQTLQLSTDETPLLTIRSAWILAKSQNQTAFEKKNLRARARDA
jgi:hypothetical protein